MPTDSTALEVFITPAQLLKHWQGHRDLTRRVIQAFPDDQLFTFSVGGMRPFSDLAKEFLKMAAPTVRGILTGDWTADEATAQAGTKADLLRLWDEATDEINELWARLPAHRFQEIDKAFGQWEGTVYSLLLYVIENEIHHRGQGYVYLRALGVEPPALYDRS